jgi:uncharacterized surface protein with fasciclin (FAS1) repeats
MNIDFVLFPNQNFKLFLQRFWKDKFKKWKNYRKYMINNDLIIKYEQMKKKKFNRYWYYTLFLLFGAFALLPSCKDEYPYDDKEPEWLGASIYDWLQHPTDKDGNAMSSSFNYFLQVINSVSDAGNDYREVLSKTGNKTLFVADDAAFEEFFKSNEYGITSFEQFSASQLRAILFTGMLNDTYLIEMMSSTPGSGDAPPAKGQAMRRVSSWGIFDSVPYERGDYLPKNGYWDRFYDNGIHVLEDNSNWTMVFFLEPFLNQKTITNQDIELITGQPRVTEDAHIFGVKIRERDITCKNGYVNVLEKLTLPQNNMAQYIRENQETKKFNTFLERYCAPYYDASATQTYRALHPEFTDSIFEKRFFTSSASGSGRISDVDPDGKPIEGLLNFDPGWNLYSSSGSHENDMGAIFVPTDAALDEFFNVGEGKFLKDRYGSWEDVPNNVLNVFINNHMKPSFVNTVASRFEKIEDKMGTKMGVEAGDIAYANVCSNGVIYVTKKAYAPTEYSAVTAPVLVGTNTRIFNWAIQQLQFDLYLLSMENDFTFLVPTDENLNNYYNPVSGGKNVKEIWKFWYDDAATTAATFVKATVYDAVTHDSLRMATPAQVLDALEDILDNHIVVGLIDPAVKYYQTKGGATLQLQAVGESVIANGGGNLERGNTDVKPINTYHQRNGVTHLLDGQLEMPTNSVYKILSTEPQFSSFYELCLGANFVEFANLNYVVVAPGDTVFKPFGGRVFGRAGMSATSSGTSSFSGIDQNVLFFNTYNYTVYVPTNEALERFFAGEGKTLGLEPNWDFLSDESLSPEEIAIKADRLYRFIRYHFQDNSVYISGARVNALYDAATLNTEIEKFYKIHVTSDGSDIAVNIECEAVDLDGDGVISPEEQDLVEMHQGRYPKNHPAHVVKSNGLYNIMARDYTFQGADPQQAASIETSSFAVIHQIDEVLYYEPAITDVRQSPRKH